jgi:signal transduction histidine kinase
VAAAAVLVGVAVLVVEIRRRRTLRAVRRLADRLASPQAGLISSAPGVTGVDFANPGASRWVDAAGEPVPDSTEPCLTLADGPDPVARVHLARGIDADAVLAALTPSTRLALRNAQLLAVGRAQVAEAQASRRRIVRTSDAERRRIERDLHDGAQQRLVSAALHLQVARSRVPAPLTAGLGAAEEQLRDALARLRRLAHGIFPAALAEDGLQAALDELATRTDVVLAFGSDLGADGEQAELGPDVELAAYATITDAVAAVAPAGQRASEVVVGVDLRRQGAHLVVEVAVPAADAGRVEAALVDAGDRVGALGGTLGVCRDGAGVQVKAVIPCVSSWPTT